MTLKLTDPFLPPEYLHDLFQPESMGFWAFPRDVRRLESNQLLITDSGCMSPGNCPSPSRLLWVDDVERTNSSLAGYWTPDHRALEFLDQTPRVTRELRCGFNSPYRAFPVEVAHLGPELKALLEVDGQACTDF
jgi:hypothetical protein